MKTNFIKQLVVSTVLCCAFGTAHAKLEHRCTVDDANDMAFKLADLSGLSNVKKVKVDLVEINTDNKEATGESIAIYEVKWEVKGLDVPYTMTIGLSDINDNQCTLKSYKVSADYE